MRVVESAPHRLTARHWPLVYWLVAGALLSTSLRSLWVERSQPEAVVLSLLFITLALVMLVLWGPVVTLTIDRRRRVVEVQRHGLLGVRTSFLHPLDSVTAPYVENTVHRGNAGRITQYRLMLMAGSGEAVPLTPWASFDSGMRRTADALSAYLRQSRELATREPRGRSGHTVGLL